jgi:hypothetical protein
VHKHRQRARCKFVFLLFFVHAAPLVVNRRHLFLRRFSYDCWLEMLLVRGENKKILKNVHSDPESSLYLLKILPRIRCRLSSFVVCRLCSGKMARWT